jgi:hypothetical protein
VLQVEDRGARGRLRLSRVQTIKIISISGIRG